MCFVGLNATWWGASFIVAKGPLLKDGVVLAQESIHELWRLIRVSTCFVNGPSAVLLGTWRRGCQVQAFFHMLFGDDAVELLADQRQLQEATRAGFFFGIAAWS